MPSAAIKLSEKIIAALKGAPTSHPEQHKVVGPIVAQLIKLGWSLDQMIFGKKEYLAPKSPSEASKREKGRSYAGFPLDIAVFDDPKNVGDYRHLVFIIETKQPEETSGLEQLDILLGREPHVRLGIWANSAEPSAAAVFVFRDENGKTHPQKKTVSALPSPTSKIDKDYRALTGKDLIVPSAESLRAVLVDMLDRIVARDPLVNRREEQLDQLCNVILLKLDSDKSAKLSPKKEVTFKAGATDKQTADTMRTRFKAFVNTYPDIFVESRDKELRFSDATLADCMEDLAPLNLLGVGASVVSIAFQVLRSAALKQEEGQYFTPQPVIAAAVRFIDVGYEDRILDPACGTGGFLVEAMVSMQEKVAEEGGDQGEVVRWAQRALHGIDKDQIAVKLTKAVMQIMGDGSAHCSRGDSVSTHRWATEYPHLATTFQDHTFSVIFTNPPFGAPLKIKHQDATAAHLDIAEGLAKNTDLELGLAMLNRCHQLLRDDGRLCIVLPETYFFSPSYRYVRTWARQRFVPEAVINVPMEAFAGFCRAKTNVYIFRKLPELREIEDETERSIKVLAARKKAAKGKVLMLNPRTCGIYKNGLTRYKVDVDGQRSRIVDNEMLDHVKGWLARVKNPKKPIPPGAILVPLSEVEAKDVLAPTYFDPRYAETFDQLKARLKCEEVTLGQLMTDGWVDIEGGHGSPSNDQRVGSIPYVKVSDIRSLRINVNPTNMIPLALAKKLWGGNDSGLAAWDLITPNRASSNIGEFAVLLPGEDHIVLTKEVFRIRVTEEGSKHLDPFYLLWALSLRAVRDQWRRIALMQTNREDVGHRHREIRLPLPTTKAWADAHAKEFRTYFTGIAKLKTGFLESVRNGQNEFIGSIYTEAPVAPSEDAEIDEQTATEVVEAIETDPAVRSEVAVELIARRHQREKVRE